MKCNAGGKIQNDLSLMFMFMYKVHTYLSGNSNSTLMRAPSLNSHIIIEKFSPQIIAHSKLKVEKWCSIKEFAAKVPEMQ